MLTEGSLWPEAAACFTHWPARALAVFCNALRPSASVGAGSTERRGVKLPHDTGSAPIPRGSKPIRSKRANAWASTGCAPAN